MRFLTNLFEMIFGEKDEAKTPYRPSKIVIPASEFTCPHEKPTKVPFTIQVHGLTVPIDETKFCKSCAEEYFQTYFQVCSRCNGPIYPLTPIALTQERSPYPFMHLRCADAGAEYAGIWGRKGQHISLHTLRPNMFPEGTKSIVMHVFTTGENIFYDKIEEDMVLAETL